MLETGQRENRVDWIDIETKLCSPFNPNAYQKDCLSEATQQIQFWFILGKYGPRYTKCISCCAMYRNMLHYSTIFPFVWEKHLNNGSSCIQMACTDQYKDGKFMSYGDLTCQFNLKTEVGRLKRVDLA